MRSYPCLVLDCEWVTEAHDGTEAPRPALVQDYGLHLMGHDPKAITRSVLAAIDYSHDVQAALERERHE